MRSEWVYHWGYYPKTKCESFIEMAKELPATKASLGYENGISNDDYRRTTLRWIDHVTHPKFTEIYDEFWKFMHSVNHDWFNFNVTYLPPLQFTEYTEDEKSEYKTHQDIFWLNPSPRHRKLTVILQLSDPADYDGGDLVLQAEEKPPAHALRQQGTMIIFPSFVYHALTPVTRGTRHSLVAWFEGPKFQ